MIREYISLDQFLPKTGQPEEVIVLGFFVRDELPARTLNSFIQRGYIDVLDSEVSPNPDVNGDYVVFVEFNRNSEFRKIFYSLLRDIENIVGKTEWIVRPFMSDRHLNYLDDKIFDFVILTPGDYLEKEKLKKAKQNMKKDDVQEFFNRSVTENIDISSRGIIINNAIGARLVDLGNEDSIISGYNLGNVGQTLLDVESEVNSLQESLGHSYNVGKFGKYVAIAKDDQIMILENLEYTHGKR